ncbi:MAG: hypothetical protein CMO55_14015 [Verrucomicrobiales bacterium]|nr:hypothetical protein [Verrucomicrobiales bacterium]
MEGKWENLQALSELRWLILNSDKLIFIMWASVALSRDFFATLRMNEVIREALLQISTKKAVKIRKFERIFKIRMQ